MDRSGCREGRALAGRREFLCSLGVGAASLLAACTEGGAGEGATSAAPDGTPGEGHGEASAPDATLPDATPPDVGGDARSPTDGSPAKDGAVPRDGSACSVTSPDIEGPFYVPGVPVRSELDLYGEGGPRLSLSGTVLDEACRPIEHALVEIWHADSQAAYDTTSAEHRYYGQVATGADGSYRFHTILPAPYLNGAQYRPRHVHMKIWLPSADADGNSALRVALTTQIYFEGDPYIAADPWASQSPDRVIPLAERAPDDLIGTFHVTGIVRSTW